jgi:putative ABC transport system ATP-binding protein
LPAERGTLVSAPTPAAASCTGLVKIYWSASGEVHALKGIDAAFPPGAVTAVVGPSGSGKSSLLRILACIDRPTAGQVRIGDVDIAAMRPTRRRKVRRRLVGYMFQRPSDNLVPYLSAVAQLQLSARLRGNGTSRAEAADMLGSIGLKGRERHLPHQLSGGEQQRVALAAAVIGGPALVVADEPTAELDSTSGERLMELVVAMAARGVGVVIATHDPVVMGVADRILSLRHGSLEAETRAARALSVIDAYGRIQLPPAALPMFPDNRAVITVEEGEVRITPP